eukprot:CAMPEP_0174860828 /NCGR_PEP_ID=MMETSP1114-20130205/50106_1 /TAXON_ID=312471 /ORGANISM="Neobodo designis, Strain CCAP 1951/1" /LENGTH=72 /DNA_ID=CAMNT_0016095813 /DNA_START=14 /DNA_END=232 /DNA_ORIENTATION=-
MGCTSLAEDGIAMEAAMRAFPGAHGPAGKSASVRKVQKRAGERASENTSAGVCAWSGENEYREHVEGVARHL